MAWFIYQSAAMILLALVLGILIGWLIWGSRVRALLIEVRTLRASVANCEANHGNVAAPQPPAPPAAPVRIPSPRSEVPDAAVLEAPTAARATGLDAIDLDPDDLDADGADDLGPTDVDATDIDATDLDTTDRDATDLDATDLAVAELDAIDVYASAGGTAHAHENGGGRSVADEGPSDDLVRIEGIGPKIASALAAAGIRTYRQVATSDNDTLTTAINKAGIHFAPSLLTWAEQAQLLADGDEAAFRALTDRLIAGRDVSKTAMGDDVPPPPPDDLARIEGIGPKIAGALVAAGIRTYRQLADADADTLTAAINAVGITFAPSLVTWSEQSRLLADGDEDAFAVLTARLIAGRRIDDDLERIEGIGPKMAAALHASGIRTYRALADCTDTRLRNAISGSGLSFAPSIVTWARQARLLADGDEDGFADLTRRLVAGRDEGRS